MRFDVHQDYSTDVSVRGSSATPAEGFDPVSPIRANPVLRSGITLPDGPCRAGARPTQNQFHGTREDQGFQRRRNPSVETIGHFEELIAYRASRPDKPANRL